jgi:hypothetical protein
MFVGNEETKFVQHAMLSWKIDLAQSTRVS